MADTPTTFQRLRSFLNQAIKGKFTNALLESLATGDDSNELNVLAMKDNLFVATAEGRYLEKVVASMGVTKPPGVGIDDDSFRNLAVTTTNSQLVTNVFLDVLELFYGEDAVKANMLAGVEEIYPLQDGMDLFIQQDNFTTPLRIAFSSNDFANINNATAVEIAAIISREAVKAGYTLYATDFLDAAAGKTYLQLFSGTRGPQSSIAVVGGSAQNIFRFPELKPTTQTAGTQITISVEGGSVRYTWTAGTDPSLQNVEVGDYVNFKNPPFPIEHAGSFTVSAVVPDVMGSGYFEVVNPLVQSSGIVNLASADDIRFFKPKKTTLINLTRYASIYEVNPYEAVVFMPATTKIVKRSLKGSWHLHSDSSDKSFIGSYIYNPKTGFPVSSVSVPLNQSLDAGQVYSVISTNGSSEQFPDQIGFVVFDFGTSNEEGPIRYLGRPSSNTLLLDASYTFKKTHSVNSDIALVKSVKPFQPLTDGSSWASYLTGTINGRTQAELLANKLVAAGITLSIIIVYPSGVGLQNVEDVYGPDEV